MPYANINKDLPLDKAELIGIFIEGILYGMALLLFIITIWVLVHNPKGGHVNKPLLITSTLLTFLSTLHVSIDFFRILGGFMTHRGDVGGPTAFFGALYHWSFIFKTSIYTVQTFLADSFATYRAYVVWHRWWAIAGPALFVLADFAVSIVVLYYCGHLGPSTLIFAKTFEGWITAYFTLTLVTNLTCTTLIASRIWFTTRKVARFSGRQTLLPVVIIVVESGAIYSLSCVIILALYLINSNAQYPALDATCPIISIVFNLIIVRIAKGISHGGATSIYSTQNPPSGIGDHSRTRGAQTQQSQYAMKPLSVTVTKLIQRDGDGDQSQSVGETPIKEERDGESESFTAVTLTKEPSWSAV